VKFNPETKNKDSKEVNAKNEEEDLQRDIE